MSSCDKSSFNSSSSGGCWNVAGVWTRQGRRRIFLAIKRSSPEVWAQEEPRRSCGMIQQRNNDELHSLLLMSSAPTLQFVTAWHRVTRPSPDPHKQEVNFCSSTISNSQLFRIYIRARNETSRRYQREGLYYRLLLVESACILAVSHLRHYQH